MVDSALERDKRIKQRTQQLEALERRIEQHLQPNTDGSDERNDKALAERAEYAQLYKQAVHLRLRLNKAKAQLDALVKQAQVRTMRVSSK
ncbi:MAG: hypothetical protein MHM6MM_008654, partial [Cercozoa sp. M6MM]